MADARVLLGDCREVLKTLEPESIDALVTDPPAGISFMGKAWDSYESLAHFQADLTVIFKEALRVLKPGAHGLVWALPRTSGFTVMALVDAGFEVRDSIVHLFGSGMPKGLNVAKAGAGPEWEGWNTTLKPAHEIWWLVRKPLDESTVVKQVLATGTGAINIEGCRVGTTKDVPWGTATGRLSRHQGGSAYGWSGNGSLRMESGAESGINPNIGRWPANAVLSHAEDCVDGGECSDDCAVAELDEQSGISISAGGSRCAGGQYGRFNKFGAQPDFKPGLGDIGGASRFFYTSKVAPNERKLSDGTKNQHPTAKSIKLMRYLVRLITPPDGTVLDPFVGSGTTAVAALLEGKSFVGIELDPEHHRVASLRAEEALAQFEQSSVAERVLNGEY
jgi:site-specific DNA-methyltransferase (adenine-specific)